VEAIIFVGIQASGKSSFYKERFFRTHVRINLDMLKTRHRENLLLRACIEMKQPFVVDNTNATAEERARYISLAREARFRVIGYYFETPAADAATRNDARTGKERVPRSAVFGTQKKLQIPTYAEGFDMLYRVRLAEPDGFEVDEMAMTTTL
jgi:predicted kinase